MKIAHVRPLGGRKLRLPERPRQILPEAGMKVALTDYWLGRIADGDAEIATPAPKAKRAPRRAASRLAPAPLLAPQED